MSSALNKLSGRLDPNDAGQASRSPIRSTNTRTIPKRSYISAISNPSVSQNATNGKEEVKKDSAKQEAQNPAEGVTEEATSEVAADANPKIEDETKTPEDDAQVDDIVQIGKEVNQNEEVKTEATNDIPPTEQAEAPLTVVDSGRTEKEQKELTDIANHCMSQFSDSLADLDAATKSTVLKNVKFLLTSMHKNQSNNVFKVNLENKLVSKILDVKQDEFLLFLVDLGFEQKSKDLLEVSDPDQFKGILNSTPLLETLNQLLKQ